MTALTHCSCARTCPQFKVAWDEICAGKVLKTVSPNLHINALFYPTGKKDCVPIMVEIQVYLEDILSLKTDSHKRYELFRAKSVEELLH